MDLDADRDRMTHALALAAAATVREDHADVILFGCTGMFGAAARVRAHLLGEGHDVPVIDPVPAAVHIAAGMVAAGLSHSKTAYPSPLEKPLPGYEWVLVPARRQEVA